MTDAVVLRNTVYMQAALDHLQTQPGGVKDEDAARLSPLIHEHVNVLGRYSLALTEKINNRHLRPLIPTTRSAFTGQQPHLTVGNGTYSPAHIMLERGKSAILTFLRKDVSPCAELVVFPALDISEPLLLNNRVEINLPPIKEGNYDFHCQMQMYRGELIVA